MLAFFLAKCQLLAVGIISDSTAKARYAMLKSILIIIKLKIVNYGFKY